jgi:hypothetical protein
MAFSFLNMGKDIQLALFVLEVGEKYAQKNCVLYKYIDSAMSIEDLVKINIIGFSMKRQVNK